MLETNVTLIIAGAWLLVTLLAVVFVTWPPCGTIPAQSTERLRILQHASRGGPGFERHDATFLYSSYIVPARFGASLVLLVRMLTAVFVPAMVVLELMGPEPLFSGHPEHPWPVYFSNLVFGLLGLQAGIGVMLSIRGLAQGNPGKDEWEPADDYDFMDKLYCALHSTVGASSIFLTPYYWVLVYEGGEIALDDYARHGINVGLIVLEAILGRTPLSSSWLIFPISFACIYTIFLWVWNAYTGLWIYESLALTDPWNLVNYALLPVLLIVAFWIQYFIISMRERVFGNPRPVAPPQYLVNKHPQYPV